MTPVAGAPRVWTRYVAIGDSFTEGMSDPHPEVPNTWVGWADRLAHHLDAVAAKTPPKELPALAADVAKAGTAARAPARLNKLLLDRRQAGDR